jgi:hypothetical protein
VIELKGGLADQVNWEGKLPIQVAIDSGRSWDQGVTLLLLAFPSGAKLLQLDLRFVPTPIANLQTDKTNNDTHQARQSFSVVFEILKSRPHIMPTP